MFTSLGTAYALLGAVIAVALAGAGSAIGLQISGTAQAGVLSVNPKLFSKTVVIQVLPATQGIYGMVVAFLAFLNTSIMSGTPADYNVETGMAVLLVCLGIGVGGLVSAIFQGKAAAGWINAISKKSELSGRSLIVVGMIETYALLSFVISLLAVIGIK